MSKKTIWESRPAEDDFAAAKSYLSLLLDERSVAGAIRKLKAAKTQNFEAKDVLRASQTHLLDNDDFHVAENLKKIKKGKKISPVLLIRGDALRGLTLTIADGHHRALSSFSQISASMRRSRRHCPRWATGSP